jgi:hypothetical protein
VLKRTSVTTVWSSTLRNNLETGPTALIIRRWFCRQKTPQKILQEMIAVGTPRRKKKRRCFWSKFASANTLSCFWQKCQGFAWNLHLQKTFAGDAEMYHFSNHNCGNRRDGQEIGVGEKVKRSA